MIRRMVAPSIKERRQMILRGNTFKVLVFLSIPTILMTIVQSFIPLSDGLFLNRAGGTEIAAAVGYSQPVVRGVNSISQGFSVAAMAIIGQINGLGDLDRLKKAASQIVILGFATGVALAPLSVVLGYTVSASVSPEIQSHVFTYISLSALTAPFLFMAGIFNSIKNSTGQPEATFYRMIILLIAKIFFNAIFLSILKLGVVGANLASTSAYILISLWMYYDLFVRPSEVRLSLKKFKVDKDILASLFKLGFPAMLSSLLINIGFFLINLEVEKYGAKILNAQTIASNISAICFMVPTSIGTTVTTMVSMNIAANKKEKAKKVLKIAALVSLAISALMFLIFYPLSEFLVRFFQDDPIIVQTATHAFHILLFSIAGFSIFMVAQGAAIAQGKTKLPLIMGIIRIWFLRYVFILVAQNYFHMGAEAVFWANLFSNTIAGIAFYLYLARSKFETVIESVKAKIN